MIMQKTCKNEHCKRKFDKTSLSDLCHACSAAFKSGETQSQGRNDLYEKKIRDLEIENLSIKTRLESLENWASKITFSKNCELENHMVAIHASKKPHACETCGKTFVLKWRLEKHLGVHQESVKTCKFFEEGMECPFEEIGCKFGHIEKETNVGTVVMSNKTAIVTSAALTTEGVNNFFDSTKNNVEEVVEKHHSDEAINKFEEGGNNTGSGERYLEPSTSSLPQERSQPFFDLDNPNVYPPIVYPQNTQTAYPQNPCIVYPQNPHIMFPQNLQTRTAGTSTLPSFDEMFPPHYIPPRSNSSDCWKY